MKRGLSAAVLVLVIVVGFSPAAPFGAAPAKKNGSTKEVIARIDGVVAILRTSLAAGLSSPFPAQNF